MTEIRRGGTYSYNQSTGKLTRIRTTGKGLTPRQRKITTENRKRDKEGKDPFWPREA